MGALYKGLIATGVLSVVGLLLATTITVGWGEIGIVAGQSVTGFGLFLSGLVGLVGHRRHRLHHRILYRHRQASGGVDRPGVGHRPRHQRHPGPRGVAGIDGAARRMVIVAGIISTYQLAGLFGTAIAVTTMLGLAGMIVALDAFGPVTDNAGGIAEMAGLAQGSAPSHRRARRGRQHHQGRDQGLRHRFGGPRRAGAVRGLYQRPAASSSIRALPYFKDVGTVDFDLSNPYVVAGLIFGGLIPYLFGGIAMTAVGRAAGSVVEEVRRQFKEKPGIMDGTERPDYGRAVDMLTKAAIKEMIVPSLLPVLAPLVVYFGVLLISGSKASAFAALGASLLGVIVNGLFVAISMTSGGGAWDNAKKSFEDGFVDKDGVKHQKGVGRPQGVGHRRHRRRPLQGHGRPGRQSRDQDHQYRRAAAAGHPGASGPVIE